MTRRIYSLFALLLAIVVTAGFAGESRAQTKQLSVEEAYQLAREGKVTLVDIRTREEWQATGVAEPAALISMHEGGFFDRLDKLVKGNRDMPVALICATGVRSAFLQAQLLAHGYRDVLDVSAGMLGHDGLPGWIAAGLPVKSPEP